MSLRILESQTDFENPLMPGIENRSAALNGSFVNGTEETPHTLTYNEIATISVIGLIGFAGKNYFLYMMLLEPHALQIVQ